MNQNNKDQETILYKIDNAGRIRFWRIYTDIQKHIIYMEYGLYGKGWEVQIDNEPVEIGKAKKNRLEQLWYRYNKRIEMKQRAGYRTSIDKAKQVIGKTEKGFVRPMLAINYNTWLKAMHKYNHKIIWIQPKLNGHRCLITKRHGKIIAYSRNGKIIQTINHITDKIKIPDGVTLDGELYIHDIGFQKLTSIIKKQQNDSALLQYYIYDVAINQGYDKRLIELKRIYKDNKLAQENLKLNTTFTVQFDQSYKYCPADCREIIMEYLNRFLEQGYEGAIIRLPGFQYENKRSKSLIKVKKFHDAEYKVVDIFPSSRNWAILVCEVNKDGKRFNVCAPGDSIQRKTILKQKNKYIGNYVTVKYAELTQNNIPFHPVALGFRIDI